MPHHEEVGRRNLEVAAARCALGELASSQIYELANLLTTGGSGASELIQIVVEGPEADISFTQPLLESYIRSEGVTMPTAESAPLYLAYLIAKEYIDGRLTALEAALKIHDEVLLKHNTNYEFGPFVYWLDEYDVPSRRSEALQKIELNLTALVNDFESQNTSEWKKRSTLS